MLITLAMGCCRERKGKKERKKKNTSIGTGALVVVMIFSPECGRVCHPKEAKESEAMVSAKSKKKLESKSNKQRFNTYHLRRDLR